jgi:glycine cleavage system regulatory protein
MESIADLYAADALSPEERGEAERHAATCAACAELLRQAGDFRRWVTGTIAPDGPPADLEERLVARFRASQALKPRRWRLLPVRRIVKALGGLAAAAGFIYVGYVFTPEAPPIIALQQKLAGIGSLSTDFSVYPDGTSNPGFGGQPSWTFWRPDTHGKDTTVNDRFDYPSLAAITPNAEIDDAIRRGVGALEKRKNNDALVVLDGLKDATTPSSAVESEAMKATKTPLATGTPSNDEKIGGERGLERSKGEAPLADAQVFVRQGELKLAEQQELATRSEEARSKLSLTPPQDNRKIIRTADVDLEVDSYEATSTKLDDLVKAEKGFIASANTQRLANGKVRAVVTVRVPPEQFETLIAALKVLGTVRNQNVGSQDITKAYIDLDTRRASKEALLERLKKLLADAKGTVKELLEVEVQMGKTIEEIEALKGELKYYDSQVAMSTLTLTISEKDLGQPFEYVQTLHSNIALTAHDADDAYAKAQKEIVDAGGQVVDSRMNRQNDGSATGTIRGRVDAEKFPALREALKRLGRVTNDTVNQQKTARGGFEGAPKADAPLKKEQAVVDLAITTPPLVISRRAALTIEQANVTEAYPAIRKSIEAAGGKIVNGRLMGRDGGAQASLVAQIDAEKFQALVEQLKTTGKVLNAVVRLDLPAATPDGAPPLLRERAEIELSLASPPPLIDENHGIGAAVRETFAGSWRGILWSIEKLFVGISLAGPWLAVALGGWFLWRRIRKKKAPVA